MTQISGSLICVTEKPAAVSEVLVRAPRLRTTSSAVVTTEPDRYPVTDGQVTFPCAPGPAVLTLISGGMPVSTVLPIVVADAESMTLQDAVVAAGLVDTSTRSELERLAAEATQAITEATQAVAEVTQAVEAAARAEQAESNAEASAATATTAATQAVDAMEQAAASAAALGIYTGTGFPEGKVTAPVGAIYTDSEATNGAVRWIKTKGTGSTGWQVEYGDTGMRTVLNFDASGTPSLGVIPAGWTPIAGVSGGIRWRRVGEEVFLYIRGLRGGTPPNVIDIPTGFATSGLPFHTITITSGEGLIPAKAGAFQVSITAPRGGFPFPDVFGTYWSAATWRTKAPWPTTLPGTPA